MARSIGEFRNFVLSKYPKMSKTQLQQLDDFVGQKQAEQALQAGGITLQDIPIEKRAGIASSLISKGVEVKSGNSKDATNLRKEFAKETKDSNFRLAQDAYNRTKEVPNTGAGDLSLIYSFIKALDPTSVVREGEINISKATGSVPENILTAYKRVKEGKLLSDQQRAEYKGEISRFYNEKVKEQQQRNAFYSGLATDMRVDAKDVIGEFADIQPVEVPELKETRQQELTGPAGFLYDFLLREPAEAVQESVRRQQEAPPPQSLMDVLNPLKTGQKFYSEIIEPAAGPAFNLAAKLRFLKGGLNLLKGGREVIKAGGPTKFLGTKRAAEYAKATEKIPTEPIKTTIKQHMVDDDTTKVLGKSILRSLKEKEIAAPDLQRKLDVWSKAYKESGAERVGKEIYATAYGKGREVINRAVPEAAKYTDKLRFLFRAPKAAQKASWLALKTAGLGKLLGL